MTDAQPVPLHLVRGARRRRTANAETGGQHSETGWVVAVDVIVKSLPDLSSADRRSVVDWSRAVGVTTTGAAPTAWEQLGRRAARPACFALMPGIPAVWWRAPSPALRALLHNAATDAVELSLRARRVYWVVLTCEAVQDDPAQVQMTADYPSLAGLTGIERHTLSDAVGDLKACGLIEVRGHGVARQLRLAGGVTVQQRTPSPALPTATGDVVVAPLPLASTGIRRFRLQDGSDIDVGAGIGLSFDRDAAGNVVLHVAGYPVGTLALAQPVQTRPAG